MNLKPLSMSLVIRAQTYNLGVISLSPVALTGEGPEALYTGSLERGVQEFVTCRYYYFFLYDYYPLV